MGTSHGWHPLVYTRRQHQGLSSREEMLGVNSHALAGLGRDPWRINSKSRPTDEFHPMSWSSRHVKRHFFRQYRVPLMKFDFLAAAGEILHQKRAISYRGMLTHIA